MNPRRVIAVAQTAPVRGDVDANLAEHLRLARCAAAFGAHVVVFPELSLTGYELDLAVDLAFAPDDTRLAPLAECAQDTAATLVVGAPVRLDSRLCVGAFIVSPDGTLEIYTKHHLGAFSESARVDGDVPPPESAWFHPGDRNPTVRLGACTAAVAVCADTGRPSHPQAAAARGATLYLASVFVIPSEYEADEARLSAYASRHRMVVAMANYGAASGGLRSAGRSTIWSDRGELICQLGATGTGVAIATEGATGWTGHAARDPR